MTDIQIVAFITPLIALADGCGVAYWARHVNG